MDAVPIVRNRTELREAFEDLGIDEYSYSLDGSGQNESYCLERSSGGWAVFYSERGNRNDEQWYPAEAQACRRLLEWVISDPTTRRRSPS